MTLRFRKTKKQPFAELLFENAKLLLLCRNDIVEIGARHHLDVHTHGLATGPVVTLLFGNAEAEVVLVAPVGRNPHFEDAEAFVTFAGDFMVVVSVLDAFEALFLAEFQFAGNRAFKRNRQGVLEAELKLAVRLHDGRFGRLDEVALLRNVSIGDVVA